METVLKADDKKSVIKTVLLQLKVTEKGNKTFKLYIQACWRTWFYPKPQNTLVIGYTHEKIRKSLTIQLLK